MICLDCDASSYLRTMDFCANLRCCSQEVTRYDLNASHSPNHDYVKIRTNIQWHDVDQLKQSAVESLKQWRQPTSSTSEDSAFADTVSSPEQEQEVNTRTEDHTSQTKEGPDEDPPSTERRCFACHNITNQPCWYCTRCTGMCNATLNEKRFTALPLFQIV